MAKPTMFTPEKSLTASSAPSRHQTSRAPAVAGAFKIIEYLASNPQGAGVSEIARSVGLGKSLCFNILTTLLDIGVVTKERRNAIWRLGPKLVELGTAVRRNYPVRTALRHAMSDLVEQFGVTCLIGSVLSDRRGAVIVDRVRANLPRTFNMFSSIGEVYSLDAPVIGRLILARYDSETACQIALNRGIISTEGEKGDFIRKLEMVRQRKFAISLGEHEPTLHAVGALVPDQSDDNFMVVCLLGHFHEFTAERVVEAGESLVKIIAEQFSAPEPATMPSI